MSVILEHLIKDHGATMAQAKAALRDWNIEPLEYRGKQVGELMRKENEVHFALSVDNRLKLGRVRLMRETLQKLLEQHGFLVTRMFKGDKFIALVRFMGFRKTHDDAKFEYYWLDKETLNASA